jgi:hypothetical protein
MQPTILSPRPAATSGGGGVNEQQAIAEEKARAELTEIYTQHNRPDKLSNIEQLLCEWADVRKRYDHLVHAVRQKYENTAKVSVTGALGQPPRGTAPVPSDGGSDARELPDTTAATAKIQELERTRDELQKLLVRKQVHDGLHVHEMQQHWEREANTKDAQLKREKNKNEALHERIVGLEQQLHSHTPPSDGADTSASVLEPEPELEVEVSAHAPQPESMAAMIDHEGWVQLGTGGGLRVTAVALPLRWFQLELGELRWFERNTTAEQHTQPFKSQLKGSIDLTSDVRGIHPRCGDGIRSTAALTLFIEQCHR